MTLGECETVPLHPVDESAVSDLRGPHLHSQAWYSPCQAQWRRAIFGFLFLCVIIIVGLIVEEQYTMEQTETTLLTVVTDHWKVVNTRAHNMS